MEDMHQARYGWESERWGRVAQSFHSLSMHITLPTLWCLHQPGSSLKLLFRGFHGGTLCRNDWLSHWPLVINSIFSLSPLSGGQQGGAERSNSLFTGWFLWQPVLTLKLSKGPPRVIYLISIYNSGIIERGLLRIKKRCSYHSFEESLRVLEVLC